MRAERGLPTSDEQGQLHIDSVNSLSFENLQTWIERILHKRDPAAGTDRSDLPYGFLSRIYHKLDPQVRACFEDVVLSLLAEMAHQQSSKWKNDAGDELLLLVGSIFQVSPNRRAPVDHLRFLIEQGGLKPFSDVESDKIDLKWRALQTLVAIEHRAESSFWKRHYDKYRREYALVTFAGLSLRDLDASFSWLEEIGDDHVIAALTSRLPRLIELYGVTRLEPYVRKFVRLLPSQQRVSLIAVAQRLGMNVSGEPYLGIFSEWNDLEILEFGRALGIGTEMISINEVRESAMILLVQVFDLRAQGKFGLDQRNAKAIVAAVWLMQDREHGEHGLSQSVIEKLASMSETLATMDFVSEDVRFQIFSSLSIMQSRVINPKQVYTQYAQYAELPRV